MVRLRGDRGEIVVGCAKDMAGRTRMVLRQGSKGNKGRRGLVRCVGRGEATEPVRPILVPVVNLCESNSCE